MMRRMAMVMAATVLALAGCRTLGRQAFAEPSVTLRDVRVVGLGVSGGELEVQLGVYNPNAYRLDARRLTYRVSVGDTVSLASGTVESHTAVQASDSTIVRIPVVFTYSGLSMAARQLLMTGSVTYRVAGDVTVWTGINNVAVPFSTTGRYSTLRR